MIFHNITLVGKSVNAKPFMLEQLYPNDTCAADYNAQVSVAMSNAKTYNSVLNEFNGKPAGLYICYTGGLGTKSLRICGDSDVLDKEIIRGMKLGDFEGAPEILAKFFGIDKDTAEATPAYVNQ